MMKWLRDEIRNDPAGTSMLVSWVLCFNVLPIIFIIVGLVWRF